MYPGDSHMPTMSRMSVLPSLMCTGSFTDGLSLLGSISTVSLAAIRSSRYPAAEERDQDQKTNTEQIVNSRYSRSPSKKHAITPVSPSKSSNDYNTLSEEGIRLLEVETYRLTISKLLQNCLVDPFLLIRIQSEKAENSGECICTCFWRWLCEHVPMV